MPSVPMLIASDTVGVRTPARVAPQLLISQLPRHQLRSPALHGVSRMPVGPPIIGCRSPVFVAHRVIHRAMRSAQRLGDVLERSLFGMVIAVGGSQGDRQ